MATAASGGGGRAAPGEGAGGGGRGGWPLGRVTFLIFFGCRCGDYPPGADVPDRWSDDGSCLTWKVSARAHAGGRGDSCAPRLPETPSPAPAPWPGPARRGAGHLPPVTPSPPRSSRPPRLSCPASCSCRHSPACSPPPRRAHKFHPPFAFPGGSPLDPRARSFLMCCFLNPGLRAPNLSAVPG